MCKAPKVYACEGVLKELLKDGVYNLWRPFHPTPWLVLSHLQTVAGGVSFDHTSKTDCSGLIYLVPNQSRIENKHCLTED